MATESLVCTARHIHHTGIVTPSIEESLAFYREVFGVPEAEIEEVPQYKVRVCLIPIGGSYLELIQPTDSSTGVARFLQERGESLHHVCFEVDDLPKGLAALKARGLTLIDQEPRPGAVGLVAFIHPKSTRGVLIELVQRR